MENPLGFMRTLVRASPEGSPVAESKKGREDVRSKRKTTEAFNATESSLSYGVSENKKPRIASAFAHEAKDSGEEVRTTIPGANISVCCRRGPSLYFSFFFMLKTM